MRLELDLGNKKYSHFSLLWENEEQKKFFTLTESDAYDLQMDRILEFSDNLKLKDKMPLLMELPICEKTSLYRQQIMTDMIQNRRLLDTLIDNGNEAHRLLSLGKFAFEKEATVYNLMKRIKEVDVIKDILQKSYSILESSQVQSDGLTRYKELLKSIINSDIYEGFIQDVKTLNELEEGIKSIKIGMNLNEYLEPKEAILLELSEEEFKYTRFPKKMGYFVDYSIREIKSIPRRIFARETIVAPDALNRLEKTMEPATLQLIKFCDQFTGKILEVLSILYHELPYYQIGYEIYKRLEVMGHKQNQPTWGDKIEIDEIYNLLLGVSLHTEEVVTNSFEFNAEQYAYILTGANRGGKTTMTQALAQCIWFAQLGFFIPVTKAVLPYVDGLYIHFPKEEKETSNYGRLGDECHRFKKIYEQLTDKSILFMNESFSGTSHYESLELATEALHGLIQIKTRVIFNTHLHELVENIEKVVDKEQVVSLVAGKNIKKSPYHIDIGRPLGKSYALTIAQKYGMSYEQLIFFGT